jgi:hypothetical protein
MPTRIGSTVSDDGFTSVNRNHQRPPRPSVSDSRRPAAEFKEALASFETALIKKLLPPVKKPSGKAAKGPKVMTRDELQTNLMPHLLGWEGGLTAVLKPDVTEINGFKFYADRSLKSPAFRTSLIKAYTDLFGPVFVRTKLVTSEEHGTFYKVFVHPWRQRGASVGDSAADEGDNVSVAAEELHPEVPSSSQSLAEDDFEEDSPDEDSVEEDDDTHREETKVQPQPPKPVVQQPQPQPVVQQQQPQPAVQPQQQVQFPGPPQLIAMQQFVVQQFAAQQFAAQQHAQQLAVQQQVAQQKAREFAALHYAAQQQAQLMMAQHIAMVQPQAQQPSSFNRATALREAEMALVQQCIPSDAKGWDFLKKRLSKGWTEVVNISQDTITQQGFDFSKTQFAKNPHFRSCIVKACRPHLDKVYIAVSVDKEKLSVRFQEWVNKKSTDTASVSTAPTATDALTEAEAEAQAVVETPATEVVVEAPAAQAVVETPATEVVVEAPAPEAVVETPATEAVVETPATEVVVEAPATPQKKKTLPTLGRPVKAPKPEGNSTVWGKK